MVKLKKPKIKKPKVKVPTPKPPKKPEVNVKLPDPKKIVREIEDGAKKAQDKAVGEVRSKGKWYIAQVDREGKKAVSASEAAAKSAKRELDANGEAILRQVIAQATGPVLDMGLNIAEAVGATKANLTVGIFEIEVNHLPDKVRAIRSFIRKADYSGAAIEQFIKDIDPDQVTIDVSAGLTYVFGESSLTRAGIKVPLDPDNVYDQVRAALKHVGV